MISSAACSYPTPVTDNSGYHRALDPYDCRPSGDAASLTHHVHAYARTRTTCQTARRLLSSDEHHIYARHHQDEDGEWMYHHHTSHSYEPTTTENGCIKQVREGPCELIKQRVGLDGQPEYAARAQASFTDASINNTRTYPGSSFAHIHQHPPPAYVESVEAWNSHYYEMDQAYYHQASIESPIDPSSDHSTHQLTSSSLCHAVHDDQRVNLVHVESNNSGVHYNSQLPFTDSSGHSDVDVTLRLLSADPAPPVSMAVYDSSGCIDISQLSVVHSERPPISSYSELSAHSDYYTNTILSSSMSSSRPSSGATGQSQTANTWKGRSSGVASTTTTSSSGPDFANANANTPLPPPPLQTWMPLPPPPPSSRDSSSSTSSHRNSTISNPPIKSEAKDHTQDPDLLPRTPPPKRPSGSPGRAKSSTRSTASSDSSRRSRTLSPSSRNQGVLKTIMMKRGGSEPKKQNLACLFCRERKIACGRPAEGSLDQTCNQCARRSLTCQYPTESRRGQHKRSKKNNQIQDHGHCVSRSK